MVLLTITQQRLGDDSLGSVKIQPGAVAFLGYFTISCTNVFPSSLHDAVILKTAAQATR